MIVGNYKTASQRRHQLNTQFEILNLQNELNKQYKRASYNRVAFDTLRPVKPKEQMTLDDIQDELKRKLSKYMLNNEEVITFLNSLKARNMLNDLDNMFTLFEQSYLIGASRIRASQMNELFNAFINRKMRLSVPPVVVGSGVESSFSGKKPLPMVKSKYLSAGARQSLMQALRLAGNDAL